MDKNVNVVLVGESGCGKDTVANLISSMYDIPIIISYTTRKKRVGDTDKTYRFVDIDTYNKFKENGDIFEDTLFNGNYYWTNKSDFDIPNWVIIVDPVGVINLKREFPECKAIHLKADFNIRLNRVGDYDRVNRDCNSFCAFPCDFVINNSGSINDVVGNVANAVKYLWQ